MHQARDRKDSQTLGDLHQLPTPSDLTRDARQSINIRSDHTVRITSPTYALSFASSPLPVALFARARARKIPSVPGREGRSVHTLFAFELADLDPSGRGTPSPALLLVPGAFPTL